MSRKLAIAEKDFVEVEWSEGDIYGTKLEDHGRMLFVAIKGHPLVVRTMLEQDLETVFKTHNASILKQKEIKETRKLVNLGKAIVVEAVTEDWDEDTKPLEIAKMPRILIGIGEFDEISRIQCTLQDGYEDYAKSLEEIIYYIGFLSNNGRTPKITTLKF